MGRRALRAEITMFSLDQKVGTAFSALLDNERRSLELIEGHENPQGSPVQSAIENTQELADHLVGWLMKGGHHTCPGHRSSKANWPRPYEGIGGRSVIVLGKLGGSDAFGQGDGMPKRAVTCEYCGTSTTVANGDWRSVQEPLIVAWKVRHELDAHNGEDVSVRIEPSPLGQRKWDRH